MKDKVLTLSKKEAKDLGLDRYYSGVCINGHDIDRSVKAGTCKECQRLWHNKKYASEARESMRARNTKRMAKKRAQQSENDKRIHQESMRERMRLLRSSKEGREHNNALQRERRARKKLEKTA